MRVEGQRDAGEKPFRLPLNLQPSTRAELHLRRDVIPCPPILRDEFVKITHPGDRRVVCGSELNGLLKAGLV